MSRVTDIRYVGYGVAAFEAEKTFYAETWGLDPVSGSAGMAWFKTPGHDEHHVVRLREAPENRVDVIAFAAGDRTGVDILHGRVVASGVKVVSEPHELVTPGGGYGFRFFSPDGLQFEISSDVERGDSRDIDRWEGLPLRISHIVLHSPEHRQLVDWFVGVLGFRVSDWLGDFMCFLRCNTAHHRVALLPGPPALNHVAYDMAGVDGMMRGAHRLRTKGINVSWGPGRHTAGDNTFSYFVTPAGFVAEYTAELEEVDFENWQPTVHKPGPMVMDQWGIGVGGPQALPHAEPNPGLFVAVDA